MFLIASLLEDSVSWSIASIPARAGVRELGRSVPLVGDEVVQVPPIAEKGNFARIDFVKAGVYVLRRASLDRSARSHTLAVRNQKDNAPQVPISAICGSAKPIAGFIWQRASIAKPASTAQALQDRNGCGPHGARISAGRVVAR
jgi:hypothetical protein